jgi:predicted MPP superfamily phosphohydrolase
MPPKPSPSVTRLLPGVRWGLAAALAVAAYANLVHWVLKPLHARGVGQPLTGFLNGLDFLVQLPGTGFALRQHFRVGNHATPAVWLLILGINLLFYFVAGFALRTRFRMAPSPAPSPCPRLSRRRFLTGGVRIAGGIAVAGLGYGLLAEPRWFRVTRLSFPVRGLPPALDGLRLVQLTDIHHGPWLSLRYVRCVVEAANALQPDLVLLTGDYIHQSADYIRPVAAELARLRARLATVAVLGNHDWGEDGPQMRQELMQAGIPMLDNAQRVLTPDGRLVEDAAEGLALCGVGDLWRDRQDYAAALAGLPAAMPRLLLSHNPDVAEERDFVCSGLRVDLMVSGHTHGGQVYVPGLGTPIVPSRYGQKYAGGLVRGPVCPVFVCRGIGVSLVPLRIGVPPEIAVLELTCA